MIEAKREAVAKARLTISDLTDERRAISSAPVNADTIARRIDAEIARAQEYGASGLFASLGARAGGFSPAVFNSAAGADLFRFLCHFDPAGLRETALAAVPAGILSEPERERELERVATALAQAEVEEEIALREADALTGGHEPRRLDARPDVLLAPLAELQAAAQAAKPSKRAA